MSYYKDIESENKIQCVECGKKLSGANKNNLKRHYKLVHNKEIELGKKRGNSDEDLPDSFKKPKKSIKINMDRNQFLKCCVGLVSVKNMPFRAFDDEEFLKPILSPYEETFQLNLNSRNIVKVLESASLKIQEKIKNTVKNKMISLKIDIASRMERHILGINIQYIENSKICINTIGK